MVTLAQLIQPAVAAVLNARLRADAEIEAAEDNVRAAKRDRDRVNAASKASPADPQLRADLQAADALATIVGKQVPKVRAASEAAVAAAEASLTDLQFEARVEEFVDAHARWVHDVDSKGNRTASHGGPPPGFSQALADLAGDDVYRMAELHVRAAHPEGRASSLEPPNDRPDHAPRHPTSPPLAG